MDDEEDVSEDAENETIEMEPDDSGEESEGLEEGSLVDVSSAKDRLSNVRENIELDRRHYLYAPALTVGTGLLVFFLFMFLAEPVNNSNEQESLNLTPYQEQYVNCPAKYLDTCTKMSKIPTEEVFYWKTQNDRIYMKLGDGRAIISTKPNSTSTGEFVTYMSAEEVDRMEGDTETSGGSNETSTNSTA